MAKARQPGRTRHGGPYLDAALICEDCVQEKDWAISPIRAVNRIITPDIRPEPGTLVQLPLVLVLSFKAGDVKGQRALILYVVSPSGKRREFAGFRWPRTLTFRGGDTGQIAVLPLSIDYDADGTYWLDIVLEKKSYSRVPLTLQTGGQASLE